MTGTECLECNESCIETMLGCAGLPRVVDTPATDDMGEGETSSPTTSTEPQSSGDTESPTTSPVAEAAVPPPAPTPPTDRGNNAASSFNGRFNNSALGLIGMLVIIALVQLPKKEKEIGDMPTPVSDLWRACGV